MRACVRVLSIIQHRVSLTPTHPWGSSAHVSVRRQNYRNAFEPESQLMCGRNASGAFGCPPAPWLIYPIGWSYVEGDAWQCVAVRAGVVCVCACAR